MCSKKPSVAKSEKQWYTQKYDKERILRKLKDDFIRSETMRSEEQSLQLLSAMWNEGVALGVLPPSDPWEGLDVDIRIAGILNSCLTKSLPD